MLLNRQEDISCTPIGVVNEPCQVIAETKLSCGKSRESSRNPSSHNRQWHPVLSLSAILVCFSHSHEQSTPSIIPAVAYALIIQAATVHTLYPIHTAIIPPNIMDRHTRTKTDDNLILLPTSGGHLYTATRLK